MTDQYELVTTQRANTQTRRFVIFIAMVTAYTSSWPDLFRPSTSFILWLLKDVDARDKPGHDDNNRNARPARTGTHHPSITGSYIR
jgi:hypothetical protein